MEPDFKSHAYLCNHFIMRLQIQADKSTIVDEAVKYIKSLQHTLQTLQKQRHDKLQNVTAPVADYEHESIITSSNVQVQQLLD